MRTLYRLALALSPALLATACSENSWNDHLDGFEDPGIVTPVTTEAYQLTDADYTTVASLAKAIATTPAEEAVYAAIGTNKAFASVDQARKLIPLFLANKYHTFTDGSSMKVTFNVAGNADPVIIEIEDNSTILSLSADDYKAAWKSDENFANTFCPDLPAATGIPRALNARYDDPDPGMIVAVSYNYSAVNPSFGGGTVPDKPTWSETSLLGGATVGADLKVHGIATAVNARGFVLTDKGGSILCYQASGFDPSTVAVGNQVIVEGTVSSFGTALQLPITSDSYSVCGSTTFAYPSPAVYTGPMMDEAVAREGDFPPVYCQITGKASVSGNYYNFTVEGATVAQGSGYMLTDAIRAQIQDGGEYTLTGYFVSVSSGKFFNISVTAVTPAGTKAPRRAGRKAGALPTEEQSSLWQFSGSKWEQLSDVVLLQTSDFGQMGLSHANFSSTAKPADYLPLWLKLKYPFAAEGDSKVIAYPWYANQVTTLSATKWEFNGSEWVQNAGATTDQFSLTKDGWAYNPTVEIVLPYSRNTEPSYSYYMATLDWVFDNISKPMGAVDTSDAPFIDYRGNAEYWSGTSAYYGNVDIRASTAKSHAPEGYTEYDGLTEDQISALVVKRFCLYSMRGALEKLHSDAKPGENGIDISYVITFTAYKSGGIAATEQVTYVVDAPGKFRYKSCTLVTDGSDADWK